jgi:hypothetical protein
VSCCFVDRGWRSKRIMMKVGYTRDGKVRVKDGKDGTHLTHISFVLIAFCQLHLAQLSLRWQHV